MGTWDVGPFANDIAADWCGDLHDAAGDERLPRISSVLRWLAADEQPQARRTSTHCRQHAEPAVDQPWIITTLK
jgi:hypothetical protein